MSIRKLFAIVIVCLMSAMTQAQEPVRMEYFLDTDPGYGNGVVITNIQIGDNLLTFDVSTATPGPHVLSVRSQDEAGRWSATLSRSFFIDRLQDITYVEYFIDNDPGVGNGKPLSLPDIAYKAHLNLDIDISTVGLSVGEHEFFVRALDALGQWTDIISRRFTIIKEGYVEPVVSNGDLNRMEYFFDTDPGYGNGFPLENPNTGENTYTMSFESVDEGVHVLSLRAQDDVGHWSPTLSRPLYVIKPLGKIAAVEYFFDTDPGEGQGTSVQVPENQSPFSFEVAVEDLSSGVHQFFIRAMNTFGEWSMLRSAKVEVIKVTGLKDVESIGKISEIYDIQGRRATDTLPKRIYIIDGHKVICK